MLIFFNDHPTPGNVYKFTNILTGAIVERTVQQRLKKQRHRQPVYEVVMEENGRIITAEYEIDS